MVQTGLSQDAPAPESSNAETDDYAPAPAPGASSSSYLKYLANCAAKLYKPCGKEIFSAIFFGNQRVGDYCCDSLVDDVGKVCHDDMTKYILTLPKFRSHANEIMQKSIKIWNYCVLQDYPGFETLAAQS
ncbi:hypothetical protein VNO78_30866 [Psophocarpus tetragonolobus]|uniref:Prolamin-like domain-containing protein n=1 Tax=Psophocarpus tetragonolobus TaxID=3891 RepID=A0AAN9X886_PSOTE